MSPSRPTDWLPTNKSQNQKPANVSLLTHSLLFVTQSVSGNAKRAFHGFNPVIIEPQTAYSHARAR